VKKSSVNEILLKAGHGVIGDAHAGTPRQVSLLEWERVNEVASEMELKPGDFGENVTTEDADLASLSIGDRILIGDSVVIQISEIGKICHSPCSIGQRLGNCIIPQYGMFAKVLKGGIVLPGDSIIRTQCKVGAVLTSSDRCSAGVREDESGPVLVDFLDSLDIKLAEYNVLPDEQTELSEQLKYWSDQCAVDLILTTGGTGFTLRDCTPEATLAIITAQAPGIAEAIRREGFSHTPYACISRAVSGLRDKTLIVNLPGSKRAVEESLDLLRTIIPHILNSIRGETTDCGTEKRPNQ
jgi:molybdenum cofactor synthesis domain-containing protein